MIIRTLIVLVGITITGSALASGVIPKKPAFTNDAQKIQMMYSATDNQPIRSPIDHSIKSLHSNKSKPTGSIHVSTQGINGQPIRVNIDCGATDSMIQCKQIAESIMAKASQLQQSHANDANPKPPHNLPWDQGSKQKQSNG